MKNRFFTSKQEFNSFSILSYDFVYVYDGSDGFGLLLDTLTGTFPAAVTSTGTDMFIQFVTDGSEQTAGFRIEFSAS